MKELKSKKKELAKDQRLIEENKYMIKKARMEHDETILKLQILKDDKDREDRKKIDKG